MVTQPDRISPRAPQRPLTWPAVIYELRDVAQANWQHDIYLVGGIVRDALLGRMLLGIPDMDLVTAGDGLRLARMFADQLGGDYYTLDADRGVGRAIIKRPDETLVLDVSSLRGEDLLADLVGRDFTINAMAISLGDPEMLIDPLGGEDDLHKHKVLRLCHDQAIHEDPIRALRSIRMCLQFKLRMEKATLAAIRTDGPKLVDEQNQLVWPERTRDELFKVLGGNNPQGATRLMAALGLLELVSPQLHDGRINTLESLAHLLAVISPRRNDNTASDLVYGLAVMTLDRHRARLQEHLAQTFAGGRSLAALLALGLLIRPGFAQDVANKLRLSNEERSRLSAIATGVERFMTLQAPVSRRTIHRYYSGIDEVGIEAVLLGLSTYLADNLPTPDAKEWGPLLDEVASPLINGFFNHHSEYVNPPPLFNGDDLMAEFDLQPGPEIGRMLERLLEEQAAGEIKTRPQALDLAKQLFDKR